MGSRPVRKGRWCMSSFLKRCDAPLLIAIGILAFSVCWSACGSSGGGGGGGGNPPPVTPPAPPPSIVGWTVLTPSVDTLTAYVSSSDGNDADDGLTPATAKATSSAGKALIRNGMPDWLLLKCGDTWTNQSFGSWNKSGRSDTEPIVIGSYGSGARPFVRTGTNDGVDMFTSTPVSHVFVVGIHFNPHTYTGTEDCTAFRLLTTLDDILIEDCFIEGYPQNLIVIADDGPGTITDFRLRR